MSAWDLSLRSARLLAVEHSPATTTPVSGALCRRPNYTDIERASNKHAPLVVTQQQATRRLHHLVAQQQSQPKTSALLYQLAPTQSTTATPTASSTSTTLETTTTTITTATITSVRAANNVCSPSLYSPMSMSLSSPSSTSTSCSSSSPLSSIVAANDDNHQRLMAIVLANHSADCLKPALQRATPTTSISDSNQSQPRSSDRTARKRDQNRRAALNYRRKKMEEKNRMHEEEMGLVYEQVYLNGKIEETELSIMRIIEEKSRKILDNEGNSIRFLCPACRQSCDNLVNLRKHLNTDHFSFAQ